jgi:hypothetical protein
MLNATLAWLEGSGDAAELAKLGFVNQRGSELSASSVHSMLAQLIRL